MPRGNSRGRGNNRGGRGNYQTSSNRNDSVHDRLGKIPVYSKSNNIVSTKNRFKFSKQSSVITYSIAPIAQENQIRLLVKKFLRNYYQSFDSPGRLNLNDFYSTDAFFSFSSTYLISSSTFGRNLLQVRDHTERISLLIHDKTNIFRFLTTFLPTEHPVNYMVIDVPYYSVNPMSVNLLQVVVSGVFKDTSDTINPLKAFTRVFILKQVSVDKQGDPNFEIFNDLFMLQPPMPDQIKKYHHDLKIANRLSQNQGQPNESAAISGLDYHQKKMIMSIQNATKMNETGSRQLLEEFSWNETEAMERFQSLMAANQIPQHFFAP